jgi:hypothetical protein
MWVWEIGLIIGMRASVHVATGGNGTFTGNGSFSLIVKYQAKSTWKRKIGWESFV